MTIPVIMPDPLSFIAPFSFDLVSNETHETIAKPTKFPVELGAAVSDHIQIEPNKYTITGVISDSTLNGVSAPQVLAVPSPPVQLIGEFNLIQAARAALSGLSPPIVVNVITAPFPNDPVTDMHSQLLAIQVSKFLCSLTTTTQSYSDMCLSTVTMVRKDDEGKAEFTCIFEHIETVSSVTVAAPLPTIKTGAPKVSQGAQTPTGAPAALDSPLAAILKLSGIQLAPTAAP